MRLCEVTVGLFIAALCVSSQNLAKYDKIAEKIIYFGQQASRLHDSGDHRGSEAAVSYAIDAYDEAVEIAPREPQAYVNIATLFLNAQRFEESIANWEKARQRLPRSSPYYGMVEERLQHTRLGLVSTARDRAYNHGNGNITETLRLTREQMRIYDSPRFSFDIATFLVMISEVNPAAAEEAIPSFKHAQNIAAQAAAGFQREAANGGKGSKCPREAKMHDVDKLERWPSAVSRKVLPGDAEEYGKYRAKPGFVATAKDVSLFGGDGVIATTRHTSCTFDIYGSSAFPFSMLHNEFWIEETWKNSKQFELYDHNHGRFPAPQPGKPVKRIKKAASVMQFAATNYYHFVLEVLPRLVMLREELEKDPTMRLIVPKDTSKNRFMVQYFALLPWVQQKQLLPYNTLSGPGERVQVGQLMWADWPRVSSGKLMTHCLAPAMHIRQTRDTLRSLLSLERYPSRKIVLYASRPNSSMRKLKGEDSFLKSLRKELRKVGAELKMFDGVHDIRDQAVQFAQASAVVGVHGAAFANTLFCQTGTLVAELAFQAPFTAHYAHAAAALGLRYLPFYLVPDERGVGADSVRLPNDDFGGIIQTIAKHVAGKSEL